jgi:TPR repeat protein
MSASIPADGNDGGRQTPMSEPRRYAPHRAREAGAAGDAGIGAAGKAPNASEHFRRVLPPAAQLEEFDERPRAREKRFEADIAARHLRQRQSLDPVPVPVPALLRERGSAVGLFARLSGVVALAALAAFVMVGIAPLSLAVKAEGDGAPASFWSRFVTPTSNRQQASQGFKLASADNAPVGLAERFAAAGPAPVTAAPDVEPAEPRVSAPAVKTVAVSPAPVEAAPGRSSMRMLDPEEIALLIKRSEDLIGQGDIAAARLMLTRAAEAGDAKAALALGSTYDASVLRKLGVLGVAANAGLAREWYGKAAELGSAEASQRLEQFAQSSR